MYCGWKGMGNVEGKQWGRGLRPIWLQTLCLMALRKGLDSVKGLVTSKSSKKADSSSNSADAVTSSEDGILDEDEGQKKDPQFSSLVIDTPNCKQCGVSFGTLTRRCHCRRCGLSFCDKHSKQRHPAPPFDENDDKSVRVCDPCCEVCAAAAVWQCCSRRHVAFADTE